MLASLLLLLTLLGDPSAFDASVRDCGTSCQPAWPAKADQISDIGRGVAVVFSPDLSVPGNRTFYESLGFGYFESASWGDVLGQIREHNQWGEPKFRFLVLETHGANGHGLKLQAGALPNDPRSYISIGALQEALDSSGVHLCFLSACNSGRLFRPEIYKSLNREPGDPLFLPPTLGIIDSSPSFEPTTESVQILRRKQSQLETLVHGNTGELNASVRRLIERNDDPISFVVSTMLIQLVLSDSRLVMTAGGYEKEASRNDLARVEAEALFQRFARFLEVTATRHSATAASASAAR